MNNMLIIVDMQNGFVNDKCHFIIPRIQELIAHFKNKEFPIIFTKFINPQINSPFRKWMKWHKLSAAPETDIVNGLKLATSDHIIVIKYSYTPFNDHFKQVLTHHHTENLYICGVDTESCVLKTAIDSFENNIKPIVITDACFSGDGIHSHEAGLLTLCKNIGHLQLKLTQDILAKL